MSSCCLANLPRPSGAIRSGKPHSLCGPVLGICSTNDSGNHSCPKLARSHCGRMPLPCHFCQYIAERVRTEHSTKPGSSGYAKEGQSEEVTLEAARDRGSVSPTRSATFTHPPTPLPLTTALAGVPLQPGLAWDLGVGRKPVVVLLYSLLPWNVTFRNVRPGFRGHPSLFPRCYVRRQPCTQRVDGDLFPT